MSARIARSAVRSLPRSPMACGSARSRTTTAPSIGGRLPARCAAVRDDVLSQRRLRYPVKLVNGKWTRISWETAIDEIGDKLLQIREKSGPDSVYWLGSAKFTNEA